LGQNDPIFTKITDKEIITKSDKASAVSQKHANKVEQVKNIRQNYDDKKANESKKLQLLRIC
jgi:hypothetical protein